MRARDDGCGGAYPVGPQVGARLRSVGPCRTPWREGKARGWPTNLTTIGLASILLTLEGFATSLDVLFNPCGNTVQSGGLPVYALQVWGMVRGMSALLLQQNLTDQATLQTATTIQVLQCVARWDVGIVVVNSGASGLFPQSGAGPFPQVSAIAHGREGGA